MRDLQVKTDVMKTALCVEIVRAVGETDLSSASSVSRTVF